MTISHCLIDCTEFDNAMCLPVTFDFKTSAIETNSKGFLNEFQDFISNLSIRNVTEPPSINQSF